MNNNFDKYTNIITMLCSVLVASRMDINKKSNGGKTVLYTAGNMGHLYTVLVLLQNNADVNTVDDDGNAV